MQIYVEDKEADAIPGITDSGYHTLDRAYELPQRYVRERLPKRYGEWRARRSTMAWIPFETPVGYGGLEQDQLEVFLQKVHVRVG